jgi:hypothetical protein
MRGSEPGDDISLQSPEPTAIRASLNVRRPSELGIGINHAPEDEEGLRVLAIPGRRSWYGSVEDSMKHQASHNYAMKMEGNRRVARAFGRIIIEWSLADRNAPRLATC